VSESLQDLRDPLASATPAEAAELVDRALSAVIEEPEEAPPSPLELAPVVLANVARESDISEEELVEAIRARPGIFPAGSAETAEDLRLALQTAAELARNDRQLDALSERERASAAYEAEVAIENASSDDELYVALDELEEAVGLKDERFQQAIAFLQQGDGGDAAVAQEWLRDRATQIEEDTQWTQTQRLEAAAEQREKLDAAMNDTAVRFLERNRAAIEKVGPTFAQLLQATGINDATSPQEVDANLQFALNGAQEVGRVSGVNEFVDKAFDAQLSREYGYHGERVPDHGPVAEVDLRNVALKTPKHIRYAAFDDAWEKATRGPAADLAEGFTRDALRAEKHATEVEAQTGKRPR
jgi:hypothetical protein